MIYGKLVKRWDNPHGPQQLIEELVFQQNKKIMNCNRTQGLDQFDGYNTMVTDLLIRYQQCLALVVISTD